MRNCSIFSTRFARSKVLRDVEIGERVGIYCAPNAEFVASVYAIWMRGAVAVPVSAFGDEADRAHVARDKRDEDVFSAAEEERRVFRRSGDVKEEEFTCGEAEIRRVHKIPKWALKPCDFQKGWLEDVHQKSDESVGALILYTSGTTGQPKGVLHTRQSLYSQAKTLSDAWEISKKDRLLHCLPLHHVHGLVNGVLASHAKRRDGGVYGFVQVRSEVFLATNAKLRATNHDVLWRTNHVRDGVATVGRVR